jgi:hypothetical protein
MALEMIEFLRQIAQLHVNDTYSIAHSDDEPLVPMLVLPFGELGARADASRLLRLVLHDDLEYVVHGYYEHAEETAQYAEQLLSDTPRRLYPGDEQMQSDVRRLFMLMRAAVLDSGAAEQIMREARRIDLR